MFVTRLYVSIMGPGPYIVYIAAAGVISLPSFARENDRFVLLFWTAIFVADVGSLITVVFIKFWPIAC